MDPLFAWIERLALGVWIRESLSIFAYPGILTLHTLGLAVLAGTHAAIGLRVLGVAPRLPLAPLGAFFAVGWWGLVSSAVTGLALVLAYPAKALTNPLFYLKLVLVALAIWTAVRMRAVVDGACENVPVAASGRRLALASLVLWTGAIVSGRLLAYTYTRLLTTIG